MTSVRIADLQYALFSTQEVSPRWSPLCAEAFRLWREVWAATFKELDDSDQVFSDDFTRQSYAGAVFHKERCVALGLFHQVDFRLSTASCDSYFKVWPQSALDKLTQDGPDILVGSNITVDPKFRGDLGNNLRLKNLVLGLMVKTLLHSPADAMTGTMRCDRHMDAAAQLCGATRLQSGIVHHGVEVELVSWYRRGLCKSSFQLDLAVESLWRYRIDYRSPKEHTDEGLEKDSRHRDRRN